MLNEKVEGWMLKIINDDEKCEIFFFQTYLLTLHGITRQEDVVNVQCVLCVWVEKGDKIGWMVALFTIILMFLF